LFLILTVSGKQQALWANYKSFNQGNNMVLQNAINANSTTPLITTQGGSGVSAPTAHGILVAEGASAFNPITLTNGQLLIGSTGVDPVAAGLTAGSGISITTGAGSITVASTVTALTWVDVTSPTQAMSPNTGYTCDDGATMITLTLPSTVAYGSLIAVVGISAGLFTIAQNAGQTIHFGNQTTTTGVTGSITSTNAWDNIYLLCTTANTTFSVIQAQGNLTVT
jgi:hypothetical protein